MRKAQAEVATLVSRLGDLRVAAASASMTAANLTNAMTQGISDFEIRIRQVLQVEPNASLARAIAVVDGTSRDDDRAGWARTPRDYAEWILDRPALMDVAHHSRINAIKEVRQLTGLGLREARDAVEMAIKLQREGWMSAAEQMVLEQEAQAAIRSIIGGSDDV